MLGYFALLFLFLTMFATCFLFGVREWMRPKDDDPIPVDGDYVRDEFYLGSSFREKMRGWLAVASPALGEPGESMGESRLLEKENGEKIVAMRGGCWTGPAECNDLIHCSGDLRLPEDTIFHKEVYATGNVGTGNRVRIQSLAADGEVQLGPGSVVERWADALGAVLLRRGAVVRNRVTSRAKILLEPGASAAILCAPLIATTGTDRTSAAPFVATDPPATLSCRTESCQGGRIVFQCESFERLDATTLRIHGDLPVPPGVCVDENLVVKGALRTANDCCFHRSVKANVVELGAKNRIFGNVISAGAIQIGGSAFVSGSVAAEGDIWLGSEVCVGTPAKQSAIGSGGRIRMMRGVIVRGKIYAERSVIAE